jgi:hypothetical protein
MGLEINPEPIKNGTEHNRGKGEIAAAGFGPLGETPPNAQERTGFPMVGSATVCYTFKNG